MRLLKTICIVVGLAMPIETLFAHNINCNSNPDNISGIISYNTSGSSNTYCELCGTGQVRIVVTNPTHEDMADFTIRHVFDSNELEYVPGTTNGGADGDPVITGGGTILTWSSAQVAALSQIDGANNHSYNTVEIVFNVRSRSGTEENLVNIDRDIQGFADFRFCPLDTNTNGSVQTNKFPLPINEPVPSVSKLGRNIDAAQGGYTSTVYGNIADDVIWRIRISNSGLVDMQDVIFDDLMQNGNFQINFACPTEGEALTIANANGAGPVGNCINSSNTINDFQLDNNFSDSSSVETDVPAGGSTDIFLVGKITNSCTANRTNTVSGVEWGCEVDSPDGGITQTSTGATAGTSTTTLSSLVNNNNLQITRALTGLDTTQDVGSRGLMTITIRNLSGGSVKNLVLKNTLPSEYVVDSTFAPTLNMTYAYGNYNGRIDGMTVQMEDVSNNIVAVPPADPLDYKVPVFTLTSTTRNVIDGGTPGTDQINVLRHGDVAVIRFRVIMIQPDHYDIEADLDVTPEVIGDHDPDNVHNTPTTDQLSNTLEVDFEDFCTGPQSLVFNDLFDGSPEDLDISIPGGSVFILTNDPNQRLPLTVDLTNAGGANADNYQLYVTFGSTIFVEVPAPNCSVTTTPLEVWDEPVDIPPSALGTIYVCDRGTIGPGVTESFTFQVVKVNSTNDPVNFSDRLDEDDLSFRADVVGEIRQSDNTLTGSGALLTFPTVSTTANGGQIDNRANNYSLDAVRAKVIGFNLTKDRLGDCSENNPPVVGREAHVEIGEECTFHIETGGWFGFQTPGFVYIAVENVQVVDQIPNGQGYISSANVTTDPEIQGVNLNPPPVAPNEGFFDWTFNQAVRITEKDKWFKANATTRILNDPNDLRAAPNVHPATSSNVLISTFTAIFDDGSGEVPIPLDQNVVGYPDPPIRTVDLTVTEPRIIVTKEACNETLSIAANALNSGANCTPFSSTLPAANGGDTEDTYVFRIRVENEASSGSPNTVRAPAYNVEVTDTLDASDLMLVIPFNSGVEDGLDNDGDGNTDEVGAGLEGSISNNVLTPLTPDPAVITFSHTHSTALEKILPGAFVNLYYKVDPSNEVAPLQILTNNVSVTYDSLEGASGSQTVAAGNTGEDAGARFYDDASDSASIQMRSVQTFPKTVTRLSNKAIDLTTPNEVSIGEEIEYQLRAFIPASNLENFEIRDTLPAGVSCVEAPTINLTTDAAYSGAGFFPGGGPWVPTCNGNEVYWNFGPQEVTADLTNNQFEFIVKFITRVDNEAANLANVTISNGNPATSAYLRYENELGAPVTLNFDQVDVEVKEPAITLTKSYESAANDASDIITVTVTAENTGTANAYNLRVFDDLDAVENLTFVGNVAGNVGPPVTDAPQVSLALGANRPVFSWLTSDDEYEIEPGEILTFKFDIQVDIDAEPLERLDNTIQASWQSLPSNTTALINSGLGPIGADGSATGMRNGAIPNAGDTLNDYETTATTFSDVPAVDVNKNDVDLAAGLTVEVGEHKNYEIVIDLPEGTTKNLVVTDNLNFSGLSYVLEHSANYDISYVFNNIATINGAAADESEFIAFPAVGDTSGTAVWNIGTVVTNSEDDPIFSAIAPSITIRYYARVDNNINVDRLDRLQNEVTVNYTNGETPATTEALTDTTPELTVTEPIIDAVNVTKVASQVLVTGGDIIQYVVTVPNTGDATAYDVNIVDTLPADLDLYLEPGFEPTVSINGVQLLVADGFKPTPTNSPGGPLIWGRGNADNTFDIPAGETLILTYHVIVEAGSESNLPYTNSVLIDWTSRDDTVTNSATYERYGNGCSTPPPIAPDDYCVGPINETITTDDINTLAKTVPADTDTATAIGTVRAGDIVTYQLSLNLQEGTTRNINVQDVLPAGMAFLDIISINTDTTADYAPPGAGLDGSNFSYADITAASLPTAGDTGTINFSIGTVANDPLGDDTTDTFVIVYRAEVLTTVTQAPTTTLTNTATLQYIDGNGAAVVDNARLLRTYDVTLLQPVMTTPTKIDRGGFVSIANVQVGVDTMQFRVESCNTTGLAPAYNVQLTDQLPTQLNDTTLTVPVVTINGVGAVDGVDYNYTAPVGRGGFLRFDLLDPVNPGECVTIDYDIGIYADFPANQTWYNSVTLDEYWSLDLKNGKQYAALGPTTFGMFNPSPFLPPAKTLLSPASGEATIGEEIVYRITIPVHSGVRHDINVIDTLDSRLEYISSTVSGGFSLTDNSVGPTNVNLVIDTIPGSQGATIDIRARVVNSTAVNAGDSFTNTLSYTYADTAGGTTLNGGAATTPTPLLITEPLLALGKAVSNITNPGQPPIGGDILRYSLTFTASGGAGGDNYSDAFDIGIIDDLSLGLVYQAASSTVDGAGNSITDPTITGDGIATTQNLTWNLTDVTADIDVDEGTVVTVTYDVLVLNTVLPDQDLTNSAVIQWTGIDGASIYERNGTATPALNDYFSASETTTVTTPDNTNITKSRLTDTYGAGDINVRIGDVIEYELRVALQEGYHNGLVVTDTLPQGLAFEAVVDINGDTSSPYNAVAPFVHNDITSTTSGNPLTGPTTVTYTIGNLTNVADANNGNDEFVIVYRVRVLDNVFVQANSTTVTNSAVLNYTTVAGAQTDNSSFDVTLLQPGVTVSKSALAAGGDTVLVPNEVVTYTVDISNTGLSPVYDVVVEDIIPAGMRVNGITMAAVNPVTLQPAGTVLPNLTPVYDPGTGVATWNFDSGGADTYSIPVGQSLRLVYTVQADADIAAGLTLTNQARATLYYSFDDEDVPVLGGITGVREIYGPSNTDTTTLTTASPGVLLKQNPAGTDVTIGETFIYRITVPQVPVATWLHDVRVTDNLSANADLSYVSATRVSGGSGTPTNIGTATNLILEDTVNGIDIAPNDQVVIDVTVVVNDLNGPGENNRGRTFFNTATYSYNQTANTETTRTAGMAGSTANMTIIEPDILTLIKDGPGSINIGVPETFTLRIKNTGDSPAYDVTVTDILPATPTVGTVGGMCDTAPTNIVARMYDSIGTTPIAPALLLNTHYTVNYTGCTLTVTMTDAPIVEDTHLVITYEAELDADTPHGATLENIAGVTQWFSLDTTGAGATGEIRTYTEPITDGTDGVTDHQDVFSVDSNEPTVIITKDVYNVTTGLSGVGVTATPGDTLRYTIQITNTSGFELFNFNFTDDLDALNATAMFEAGTLNVTTIPLGADNSNTNTNGGSKLSGLVDIRNLSLGTTVGVDDALLIEYEVQLVTSIPDATVVLNQGTMLTNGTAFLTDDPNIGGTTDPTEIEIESEPLFLVEKISTDLTGDPTVLSSGDTLRYTITVKNIGTEDAINTYIRDQLPANTTYVTGSTRLNGNVVVEPIPGTLPLQAGILINAPEDLTSGNMRADATVTTLNVSTITFDVTINANVVNGTIISNQAYVSADGVASGATGDTPSDDPGTPLIPNDPTRDVVGNQPLIDVLKTVSIVVDNGTPGVLDPGDIIRYYITITNSGAADATLVTLTDAVPANTTYIADSTTLNSLSVAVPDGGISPLIAGIDVSSSDLAPPLPGAGTITRGQSAVVTFDVQVDAATAVGTIISNQGFVDSYELPIEPTDADGIDSNGDQPTLIVVGNQQQLSIIKSVAVIGGGPAVAGGELEYRVRVTNISSVDATNVVIYDNLDADVPPAVLALPDDYLTYVPGSALLDGSATEISFTDPTITADYSTTNGNLLPGQSTELVFRAQINNNSTVVPIGTTITNTAYVNYDILPETETASVSIDIGGVPGVANVTGTVWHDANLDNVLDAGETILPGWNVDIYRNNILLGTVISDANGVYSINGLIPNYLSPERYEIKFRSPGSTSTTALLGDADSPAALSFTNGQQRIYDILLYPNTNVVNMNMPIEPNGVVYNSIERTAISSATISLLHAGSGNTVSSACFDDPNQQNQVTTANGYYKFDLNFSLVGCTAVAGDYLIQITPPVDGYSQDPSVVILPQTSSTTAAYDVPACSADAIPATANICEAETSELAPDSSIPAGPGTTYYLHLTLDNGAIPEDSQLFNNHLPIDPILSTAVTISKVSSLVNVTRSQLVPYTITVKNKLSVTLPNANIIDSFPPGFKYVQGSARLDGVAREPTLDVNNLRLIWSNVDLVPEETLTFKFLLIVGAAVNEGEYINRANVEDTLTNTAASGTATATVRVIPDPAFDCTDVIGKVFDDKNLNGYQDEGEKGLAGARVVTARGLNVTSDKFGRFHVTCAAVPDETRGSNFIMKLDERSLPSGYRVTTENPRVLRATRGKMLKFNFGTAIHRVVSMDMADGVFEKGSDVIKSQWLARIDLLIEQLKQKPSILRLSYLADIEDADLVEERLESVQEVIVEKWEDINSYELKIETDIFWRRGGPADFGDFD